ncbi:MAG: anchored repeat ABC transporter, substrate-binding protein [Acidimicrobiia bacterium]
MSPVKNLPRPFHRAIAAALGASLALAACSTDGVVADHNEAIPVVVTTEILADMIRNVGGDRIDVVSIVPHGGDPHSYEPTPADAIKVTEARAAFSNHLLLEDHAMIRLLDNNVTEGIPNIDLAEHAERYGARLRPLVENVTLDVLWLGLAVRGKGPNRAALVHLQATELEGPGDFYLYLTDALGSPEVYIDSSDGLDDTDHTTLPPGAHTHLNWAFTEPGRYDLTLEASLDAGDGSPLQPISRGAFTFAVGIDPVTVDNGGRQVVAEGHADAAIDLDTGRVFLCTAELSCADHVGDIDAGAAVIDVPTRALVLVPDGEQFRFLGDPGAQIYELPQAVLGKHVHGEIDPHLWQDVSNAIAYVRVMADVLIDLDSAGREIYEANRDAYVLQLETLDEYVRSKLAEIPTASRHLITTHDAFGYMAAAYGLEIAGFVVPNPAQEPSAAQVTRLTETIRNLAVPAVFIEPNLATRASVLQQVAQDQGVEVCLVYGDSFDRDVQTYIDMMRHNADELLRCLGGQG